MDLVCHHHSIVVGHFGRIQRYRNPRLFKKRGKYRILLLTPYRFLVDRIGIAISHPSHPFPVLFATIADIAAHIDRAIVFNTVYWIRDQQCHEGNPYSSVGHHFSAIRFGQALTGYVNIEIFK